MKSKAIAVALILPLTIACAPEREKTSKKLGSIHASLRPYVDQFEAMYGAPVTGINFSFKSLEGSVIGQCWRWSNPDIVREIYVDPEYWNTPDLPEEQKIGLVFHEIGHCLLDRDHTSDRMLFQPEVYPYPVRVPSSLMYPYNFYSVFYNPLKTYYYTELMFPETRKAE